MVVLLRENGAEWGEWEIYRAAHEGNIAMLRTFIELGAPRFPQRERVAANASKCPNEVFGCLGPATAMPPPASRKRIRGVGYLQDHVVSAT